MDTTATNVPANLNLAQIAWVVKDIQTALRFFQDVLGISNFSKVDTFRVKDFEATYSGKPSNAESLVSIAYSDGTFIELIQPLSGNSIFQDYIDNDPSGGIQHIAYRIPVAHLDKTISGFENKGFSEISYFNTPIAKIAISLTKNFLTFDSMSSSYDPEQYWDEVADNISNRKDLRIIAGDDEPYYRYKRKRFLELLNTLNLKDKDVLEIGSGPGGNLAVINDKGAKRVTGVDISSHMVDLAKKNLQGTGAEIVKINGQELPFEDNTFNVVFTSTVLQHNTNEVVLKALVKEIARVSSDEVLLFERIESRIKGHESNIGRPISYYQNLLEEEGFELNMIKSLPIQASYYTCGVIRKVFNPGSRKEGEALSKLSIFLERLLLPVTSLLDKVIPSHRDVTLLQFRKRK